MGKFLVVTGPSAVGKSTIVGYILNSPEFCLSVSYTTRRPRPWEIDGVHYHFVSVDEFKRRIADGFFLEHTVFSGNHYGTPSHLDMPGKTVVFDIDIRGYRFFRERHPRSYFCLVTARRGLVEGRLENRMKIQAGTVDAEELGMRMRSFEEFDAVRSLAFFDRIIDNSGTLEEGFLEADALIESVGAHFCA